MQDLTTGSQSFYLEHSDDIISLTVNQHPKFSGIVASGQLGPLAPIRVWEIESKKTLSVMQVTYYLYTYTQHSNLIFFLTYFYSLLSRKLLTIVNIRRLNAFKMLFNRQLILFNLTVFSL